MAFCTVGVGYFGSLSDWDQRNEIFGGRDDYFTKWVEAKPLAKITQQNVKNFVWKSIMCRFEVPKVLVSDNGRQFDNTPFRKFCEQLGINNHYSSPSHPQANGQAEVTNQSLLKIIKTWLEGQKEYSQASYPVFYGLIGQL